MANSKKITGYTGSSTSPVVPTAIANSMVRAIVSSAFTSAVEAVMVNTFKDDIAGAPWGAQNVVWKKEPTCSIAFNANGGTGSMSDRTVNIGLNYIVPSCEFSYETSFIDWRIGSAMGPSVSAGVSYAFPDSTTLYANWALPAAWRDNNKATWADANAEGWLGSNNTITGFSGSIDTSSIYNIPKMVNGTYINILNTNAFSKARFGKIGCKGSVIIGTMCFSNCSYLTEVSFPQCLNVLNYAFMSCTKLSSIEFPACLLLGSGAFQRCTSLVTVSFPACTTILSEAFASDTKLSNIYFPNCLSIEPGAFINTNLSNWEGLVNSTYADSDGCLIEKSTNTIVAFAPKANLDVVNSAPYVGNSAFSNCSIKTVSLINCTSISAYAFYSCPSLSTANIPMCTTLGTGAFLECRKLTSISLPNCTLIGALAFYGCRSLSTAYIPNCTQLNTAAFSSCYALLTISLPNCSTIWYSAFNQCTSLSTLYLLSNTLTVLKSYASLIFYNCYKLLSIYVPENLLESYLNDTNWFKFSSKFIAYSE